MAARTADSSFQFPILTSAPREGAERASPALAHLADRPLGAARGLAFALMFEAAVGLVGYSGWQLWHFLR